MGKSFWARRSDELRQYLLDLVEPRMRLQMRGGVLPNEMHRPTSLFYVSYGTEGMVRMAAFAQLEGIDYWHWRPDSGSSVLVRNQFAFDTRRACAVEAWTSWIR